MLGLTLASLAAPPARAGDYQLGPQDRLRIKVFEWRANAEETHEWASLSGEFVVGASGKVSLPLLGEIDAAERTPREFALALAQSLQRKVGLTQAPEASVEVLQYRPFYILGDVDKPGEYPFRPGMTVIQAVAVAGGALRTERRDPLSRSRDALVNQGELRDLLNTRLELLARQTRTDAEQNAASSLEFTGELSTRGHEPRIARMVREESLRFSTTLATINAQRDRLTQSRELLRQELKTLADKDAAVKKQAALAAKELEIVSSLVTKGLSVTSHELTLQEAASQLETQQLDVNLATLKANQELVQVERDISELEAKRRTDALAEAAEIREKLATVVERIETTRGLINLSDEAGSSIDETDDDTPRRQPTYAVERPEQGTSTTLSVSESDLVQPGDVVRVVGGGIARRVAGEKPSTAVHE
jgi:polysaccharide export outer membrane protein